MQLTKRQFIGLCAYSAGGLLIAGRLPVADAEARATENAGARLHPLIHIGADGTVEIFAQNPEIGEGIKTALPMIIAEELDVPFAAVRVSQADFDPDLEYQFTGGSLGIRLNYANMRNAGALARHLLVAAAAARWHVDPGACTTEAGFVVHPDGSQRLAYGALGEEAARQPVPEEVPLKNESAFRIIGTAQADPDIAAIVTGRPLYAGDIRLPNCLYAAIARRPKLGGRLRSFDGSAAQAVPGVRQIIEMRPDDHGGALLKPNSPNFRPGVAVLADSTWAAFKGRERLRLQWDDDGLVTHSSDELFAAYRAALEAEALVVRDDGDVDRALAAAVQSAETQYEVAFLAHIPMEPMNATVHVKGRGAEVWAPTQNPAYIRDALVTALDLDPAELIIHNVRAGGAFGRRYYADFVVEAAVLSAQTGAPVQVMWSREDDIRNDFFRPAGVHSLRSGLDRDGRVAAWQHRLANASRSSFLGRDDAPNGTEIDEYAFPAGLIDNLRLAYSPIESDVPLGQWRAVAHSSNAFAVLSFIDELAAMAARDPIDFFLDFIGPPRMATVVGNFALDISRLRAVAERVAELADWSTALPFGSGRGFAACYNQGSFVAEVVHVRMTDQNRIKIERVDAVLDCGRVINPAGALAQVEGSIIEGLGAAIRGQITVAEGAVVEGNFDRYEPLRISEIPEFRVEFINQSADPRGLGEPPLPPAAPALANAIYRATGRRLRRLPLRDQINFA